MAPLTPPPEVRLVTPMLQEAVAAAALLPSADQDALAARILDEIADDRRWDESFARSQPLLEKLANAALEDRRAGRTRPGGWDELGVQREQYYPWV
ncbi:MAG: hypothetical protein ACRC7O_08385 [Fimbriiglobus sp.]